MKMNNSKKWFCKSVLLFSLCGLLFTSCGDDKDEPDADYVGTWVSVETTSESVETTSEDGLFAPTKNTLVLTANSFSYVSQLYFVKYFDLAKMEGSITVSGDKINATVTGFGMASEDVITTENEITVYKEGSSEFNSLIESNDIPTSFEVKYSVSGNFLTLSIDGNNDGDYTDENETVVYTKQ